MRKLAVLIATLMASLMVSAAPLLGADEKAGYGQKDECLLVSMNCRNQVDTIMKRIDRLNTEISKGTAVYTTDELRNLNEKLDDANRTLSTLLLDS